MAISARATVIAIFGSLFFEGGWIAAEDEATCVDESSPESAAEMPADPLAVKAWDELVSRLTRLRSARISAALW